jgi:hypothetical protein
MPMHVWTKVEPGFYHDFHNLWLVAIRHALNNGVLPAGYYAMTEQKSAGIEADILTLSVPPPPTNGVAAPSGAALGLPGGAPAVGVLERGERARHRKWSGRRLAVRHVSNHKVVAVVELVSPGNKDHREDLAAFGEKAVLLLAGGIHLLMVDPFPPPGFAPAGLHAAIWKKAARVRKGRTPFAVPADRPLLAASYCTSSAEVTAAVEVFAVGRPVPAMPLYLTADGGFVTVPLEDAYMAAWPEVPKVWQDVVAG